MASKIKKIFICGLAMFLIANFLFAPTLGWAEDFFGGYTDASVLELNQKIKESKERVRKLTEELEKSRKQLSREQASITSLEKQLTVIDNRIVNTELDAQITKARLDTLTSELEKLELQIKEKEEQIEEQVEQLINLIKIIYKLDQKSYLEVLILNDSFSDFFNQLQYTNKIQDNLRELVDQLKKDRQESVMIKSGMEIKKNELTDLKIALAEQLNSLDEQQVSKELLLDQTKSSEKQYQSLVLQLKNEQRSIDADIAYMERTVRQKLLGEDDRSLPGVVSFMWPVPPTRGISAYFHDPTYPYRNIFEHPAIDIRAGQGTPIKVAESGIVGRVKYAGDSSYAYILVIHGDGLSTVYGHTSRVFVNQDDYVTKGQVIGEVGGMPGTPGAGRLTTGPHLHFEVRKNGIPVNALEYLP